MAHELTMNGDVAEMAFVGQTPWHGLGQRIDANSSIEEWQKAAGMDWEIYSSPVMYYSDESGYATNEFSGQNVLFRSDNEKPLSVVSNRYNPVQPKEVLEFFRDLVEENDFRIHTAGTLFGGKRLWALAETGKFGEIAKNDGIGAYLLLSTSCDRSLSTTARFTTVRVVCNNTLGMATANSHNSISFSHIQKFDHELVKQKLAEKVQNFGAFLEMGKFLQKRRLTQTQAGMFVKRLVLTPIQEADPDFDFTNHRGYKKIMALFNGEGMGAEMVGDTKWGLLNAITEYYDHHHPARSQDARLNNAWFGRGDEIKNRAVMLLTA